MESFTNILQRKKAKVGYLSPVGKNFLQILFISIIEKMQQKCQKIE